MIGEVPCSDCHNLPPVITIHLPPISPSCHKKAELCATDAAMPIISRGGNELEWFGHQETHWLLASVPTDTFDTGCNHCNVFSTLVLGCSWVLGKCPDENPMFLESLKWVHSKKCFFSFKIFYWGPREKIACSYVAIAEKHFRVLFPRYHLCIFARFNSWYIKERQLT